MARPITRTVPWVTHLSAYAARMTATDPDDLTRFFEPDEEVAGCDEQDLARIATLFGLPLPPDYVDAVRRFGGYAGDLLRPDGTSVQYFPVNDADGVEEDMGHDTVEELGIAVAGADSWRWILHQGEDGPRYLDVDLGSGDVLDQCAGSFADLLAQVVARADEEPSGRHGTVVSYPGEIPVDPLDALDPSAFRDGASPAAIERAEAALGVRLPADLRAVLERTDGYEGPLRIRPWGREIGVELLSVQEIVDRHPWDAAIRAIWPGAIVVGGWDPVFPFTYDAEDEVWFQPFVDNTAEPFQQLGTSLPEFLMNLRGEHEE